MRSNFLGLTLIILTLVTTLGHESAFAGKQYAQTGGSMECTDPAKPVVVAAGQDFTITLPSNRSTGYTWRLAQPLDQTIVKLSGSDFVASRSGLDGAPGKEIWSFHAAGRGTCIIAFEYVRPWEKDRPPAKEARFTLIVK